MVEAPANLPAPWRSFSVNSPIGPCAIDREGLKRLFDIISAKQNENIPQIMAQLQKQPNETDAQFQERCASVRNALVTTISITAPNGETIMGRDRNIFESATVPERIVSIYIDTSTASTSRLNYTPNNRASVYLDFNRPNLIDFSVTPSAPTLNGSKYSINGDSEAWVTSLAARLQEFFTERKASIAWIHKQGCYDALVMFLFIPVTFWGCYRLGGWLVSSKLPGVLTTALYVYMFLFILNIFRILFSYTRWVFPGVELKDQRSSWPPRHRAFWYVLLIGILGTYIYDAIRLLLVAR